MDFPSNLKHGFETNTLLTNVSLGTRLGALANVAYCSKIRFGEAIFVAFNDDAVHIHLKRNERCSSSSACA